MELLNGRFRLPQTFAAKLHKFIGALNRDVLVPRPAGRFLFGRLIGREIGKLLVLPLGAGARQQVVSDPPWLAVAVRLVRDL